MKKTTKVILIAAVCVMTLAAGTVVAFAATGVSNIEDLFYAFRSAQADEAVSNGDMTQDEADEYLDNLLTRMQEDDSDAVPPLRGKGMGVGMGGRVSSRNAIEMYAEISGLDADDIRDTLHDSDTTIFAMADESGDLEALKAAMLEGAFAHIDELVEDGRIDEDKAEEMKADIEETIGAITADTEMEKGPQGGGMGGRGGRMPGGMGGNTCES